MKSPKGCIDIRKSDDFIFFVKYSQSKILICMKLKMEIDDETHNDGFDCRTKYTFMGGYI